MATGLKILIFNLEFYLSFVLRVLCFLWHLYYTSHYRKPLFLLFQPSVICILRNELRLVCPRE